LRKFDQKEFVDLKVWKFSGLAEFGYVFFPEQCIENDSCKVHVHLHGCGMGYENIFFSFIELSGLNDYAVTNDLIVLYPQANGAFPFNLYNCWNTDPMVMKEFKDTETRYGNTGF
jgi:hypothetical protein